MNLENLPPLPPLSDSEKAVRFQLSSPSVPVLILADTLTGNAERITEFPHILHESDVAGKTLAVEFAVQFSGSLRIAPASGGADAALVNGALLQAALTLENNSSYTLQIGRRLLVFQANPAGDWPGQFNREKWCAFNTETGELLDSAPPREILYLAAEKNWNPAHCAVCPEGLDTGFHLGLAADILSAPEFSPHRVAPDKGRQICPACWLRFDAGDALSIAVHESLRNDPVLGTDVMLRFCPTRFNDIGHAIDPMGLPCTELACPHCRRQLPPGFLELPHKIFSLIGAPSSGKSYFLSVLTKVLQDKLPHDFGLVFKDGDPTGNMLLNQMRNKLFSGATPEECVLGKTAMEGTTYEKLPRFGKWVAMPRPFVYRLGPGKTHTTGDSAIIFYDNAGEHFEPGHNMDDSPGALHVVSSAGIFFLYDPTSNPRFRQELAGVDDPQLSQRGRTDQQDSILAEMEVRIKKMLGLAPAEKIPVPVAVLVGKCDVWQTLFDARTLPNPVNAGKLDGKIIDENSDKVRALFEKLCPGLVAHVESLSNNVRYFAGSSLGHSPSPIASGPNVGLLAPDPKKLSPVGIEAPAYWLLSKAFPGIF